MKKSILVLVIPCLVALTLIVGDVVASSSKSRSELGFTCVPAKQTCFEMYFGGGKFETVPGLAIVMPK